MIFCFCTFWLKAAKELCPGFSLRSPDSPCRDPRFVARVSAANGCEISSLGVSQRLPLGVMGATCSEAVGRRQCFRRRRIGTDPNGRSLKPPATIGFVASFVLSFLDMVSPTWQIKVAISRSDAAKSWFVRGRVVSRRTVRGRWRRGRRRGGSGRWAGRR